MSAPAEKKREFPDRKIKTRAPLAFAASIVVRSSRHALVGIALAAAARQIRIVAIVPHISKEKTLYIFVNVFPSAFAQCSWRSICIRGQGHDGLGACRDSRCQAGCLNKNTFSKEIGDIDLGGVSGARPFRRAHDPGPHPTQ